MTDTNKTLTQLATELGVSRDKIIYRYKKLNQDLYFKENNTIYIKEAGVQQIIDELGDEVTDTTPSQTTQPEMISINDYLISQLAKKDEQIEQLQKLIDQQQQLNAEDKKLIKELHQYFAIEAPKETGEPAETTVEENHLTQLEIQVKKAEALEQEKITLEQELASLKQEKKWFQFWK